MPDVVAIIPARGGSAGVPRKNLQEVGGIPLVVRSIHTAQAVEAVSRVAVSTDDDEIAAVSRQAGSEVVKRPAELAVDTSTSESALLHAVDALRVRDDDIVLFLQCTSPFTRPDDIERVADLVRSGMADSALTAVPFHGFLWREREDGSWAGVNHPADRRERRQDRPEELLENGGVYAMRAGGLRRAGFRFHGRVVAHSVDAVRALEVDEPHDLLLARQLSPMLDARTSLAHVTALVCDFDGVFTDNRALTLQDGTEGVLVHRGDGWGIARLREAGVKVVVLSTEENPVVAARCAKLGIEVRHALGTDKSATLREWLSSTNIDAQAIAYVANDMNDLTCMKIAGLAIAVSDAVPAVKERANVVLRNPGGHGAVREVCDMIIEDQRRTA